MPLHDEVNDVHFIRILCKTQALVSYASGESEFYGIVRAVIEALFMKHFAQGCQMPFAVKVLTDSSAAKGAVSRVGVGSRMKHLKANTLFIQQYIKNKDVRIEKTDTATNGLCHHHPNAPRTPI